MNQKEAFKFAARGVVCIYAMKDDKKELQATSNNAVLPNAKYLISRLLMKDSAANIANIRVYNGAILLAIGIISVYNYVNPNEVHYEALIPADAFSGLYTKIVLGPADDVLMGNFSEVSGLALNKLLADPLLITWNIKIN
jgi:hypothetical protein